MQKNGNGKRKPQRLPEFLDEQEQEQLLACCPETTPSSIRNRALLVVMLHAGLRASEVASLRLKDLEENGRLWVREGKGKKDRCLWVNEDDMALLKRWLATKPLASSIHQPSSFLFTSLDGRRPLCKRWMRKMVVRMAQQAGITKAIHVHSLRHSFGTRLLKSSKNLFVVSRALGHANLSSPQVYLHLQDGELEEALREMSNGNP